jgi:hypothetical protein
MLLLLLLSFLHYNKATAPTVYFSTSEINIISSGAHQKFTAGIISIQFDDDQTINIHRETDPNKLSSSILSDVDAWPEVIDTIYGLLQFRCESKNSKKIVLTLDQRVPNKIASLPLGNLFPTEEIVLHKVPWLASMIARTNLPTSSTQPTIEIAIIWDKQPHQLISRVQNHECSIDFLNKSQQTWVPKGSFVSDSKDGMTSKQIVGSIIAQYLDTDDLSSQFKRADEWPKSVLSSSTKSPSINKIARAVSKLTSLKDFRIIVDQVKKEQTNTTAAATEDCVSLPQGITDYANNMVLLETESKVNMRDPQNGIAGELPKLIETPVSDIIKPVMKLLGAQISEHLVESMNENMGLLTSTGLTGQIVESLSSALINSLSKGIPATTMNTIPFVVVEGLAESLMLYITEQVTNELVDPLASKLSASLGSSVPPKVDAKTPKKITSHVTKSLIHSLTRSVSHTVVPSLVHTLTHSPLQDYYCYYCFHHRTYCQYCQYSPSQLYYALYYTGFYST